MKKKLLTICIPTYNRSIVIGDLVDLLIYQVNKFDDCAIAISDNSDNTLTEELLKPYLEKYPDKISYNRNDENIGAFRNLDKVAKMIDSEYVWFMGDDDFVFSYSVSKIRNFILENEEKKLGFIFLNSCGMDSNLDYITSSNEGGTTINRYYAVDDFYLFHTFGISLGHFSRLIYKQSVWINENNLSLINKYCVCPHLNTLISVISKYPTAFYSSITVINTKRRKDVTKASTAWSGFVICFWTNELLELKRRIENYSKKKINIRKKEIKNILLAEWKMAVNRDAYTDIYNKKRYTSAPVIFKFNCWLAKLVFSNKNIRNQFKSFLIKNFNMNFLD
jgi:glycosyltransferase involved in cell wall biosynthesis